MSALTVTLGADISVLKRGMAAATQLVAASARSMSAIGPAGFEQTKAAFTTMIGDAAKAEATLARLRELGAQTPFEFPELADAGRKLIAFGNPPTPCQTRSGASVTYPPACRPPSMKSPNSTARPVCRDGSSPRTSTSSPAAASATGPRSAPPPSTQSPSAPSSQSPNASLDQSA
jgi:hypothetical protein